jgi:hypothetical protein
MRGILILQLFIILIFDFEDEGEIIWLAKYDGENLILSGTGRFSHYKFFLKEY